jgi:hypothetical protein
LPVFHHLSCVLATETIVHGFGPRFKADCGSMVRGDGLRAAASKLFPIFGKSFAQTVQPISLL